MHAATLFFGQHFPWAEMGIDEGEHFQALALGKDARDVPPEILAQRVEVVPWMERDVGFHLEIVPVVGIVAEGSVKRPGVDQPFNPAGDAGFGDVVGSDHVDLEGQHRMRPDDGHIDRRVHAVAGGQHLGVIGDIDGPVFVRRSQQFRDRRAGILRRRGRDFRHRPEIGNPQPVVGFERGDRRRADRAAGPEQHHFSFVHRCHECPFRRSALSTLRRSATSGALRARQQGPGARLPWRRRPWSRHPACRGADSAPRSFRCARFRGRPIRP